MPEDGASIDSATINALYRNLARRLAGSEKVPPDATIAAMLFVAIKLPPSEFKSLSKYDRIPFLKLAVDARTRREPVDANVAKLFPNGVPGNSDLVDLAVRLDSAKGTGESMIETARKFTGEELGKEPQAKTLLASLRMMRIRGKLNL